MIELKNIGAIKHLSLTAPPNGGVVVLRGRNGSGKTTALDAIQAALSGRGSAPLRDGETSGTVSAGGVTMIIGRSTRRAGELDVATIEGRLTVATLVDPGVIDSLAADARRIKSLVSLAGVTGGAELWQESLGELWEAINLRVRTGDDPLAAASDVKRLLEAEARRSEAEAERAASEAAILRAEHGHSAMPAKDVAELNKQLKEAITEHERLISDKSTAESLHRDWHDASNTISRIGTVEAIQKELDGCLKAIEDAKEVIRGYDDSIRQAESDRKLMTEILAELGPKSDEIAHRLEEARSVSLVLGKALPPIVDEKSIGSAKATVDSALAAVTEAAHAEKSRVALQKASDLANSGAKAAALAERFRIASSSVEHRLCDLIGAKLGPLRIVNGRLITDTVRGETLFAELSHGERWRIALDIAIDEIDLIVIPQEAWEGLDRENREAIAAHLRSRNAIAITAEATSGEMEAAHV